MPPVWGQGKEGCRLRQQLGARGAFLNAPSEGWESARKRRETWTLSTGSSSLAQAQGRAPGHQWDLPLVLSMAHQWERQSTSSGQET